MNNLDDLRNLTWASFGPKPKQPKPIKEKKPVIVIARAKPKFWVCVIRGHAPNTFYVGHTNDLLRRIREHRKNPHYGLRRAGMYEKLVSVQGFAKRKQAVISETLTMMTLDDTGHRVFGDSDIMEHLGSGQSFGCGWEDKFHLDKMIAMGWMKSAEE